MPDSKALERQRKARPLACLLFVLGTTASDLSSTCTDPINSWEGLHAQPLTQLTNFPPGSTTQPLEVHIAVGHLLVTSLDQVSGTWSGAYEADTYWLSAKCANSFMIQTACTNRVGNFYFVHPEAVSSISTRTSIEQLGVQVSTDDEMSSRGVFDEDFGKGCVSHDSTQVDFTQHQEFDMTYHPYERHLLKVTLTSKFSTDHVLLSVLDSQPAAGDILGGFSYTSSSWTCVNATKKRTETARGGSELGYAQVTCSIEAFHEDIGWLGKDYAYFMILMLTSAISTLASARSCNTFADYQSQLRARAKTYSGLTLSYLFAMTPMPYGGSVDDFAGELPMSWWIYTSGLLMLGIVTLITYGIEFYIGRLEDKKRMTMTLAQAAPGAVEMHTRVEMSDVSGTTQPVADDHDKLKVDMDARCHAIQALDRMLVLTLHASVICASVILLLVARSTV